MTSPLAPAGWYQDPASRHQYRYWDGTAWSAMVADNAVTSTDPLNWQPAPQAAMPQQSAAQEPAAQQPAAQQPVAQQPGAGADQRTLGMTELAGPPGSSQPGQASGWQPGAAGQWQPQGGQWQPGPSGNWQQAQGGPGQAAPGGHWPPGQGGQWPQGPAGQWPAAAVPAAKPATPKRRRRLIIAGSAVAVAVVLVIGLVIWAPWTPPPVLRPLGLAAGTSTTSSVGFRWAAPASGPVPDKYLILQDGHVVGSVSGSVDSYQISNLAPASTFQYNVVAERGGKKSPVSAPITLKTLVPPISDGRLDGPYSTTLKVVNDGGGTPAKGETWVDTWTFQPQCASGACTVVLSGHVSPPTYIERGFTVTLTRSGSVYTGRTTAHITDCSSVADHDVLVFKINVGLSGLSGSEWLVTQWSGTLTINSPYQTAGNYYCPASTRTISMGGTP